MRCTTLRRRRPRPHDQHGDGVGGGWAERSGEASERTGGGGEESCGEGSGFGGGEVRTDGDLESQLRGMSGEGSGLNEKSPSFRDTSGTHFGILEVGRSPKTG